MIERVFFSIKEGFRHKAQLKAIPYESNIVSIDWRWLYQSGMRVVVLDFDGVLAADKQKKLYVGVDAVLATIQAIFGDHVYIFSNQPTPQRQAYFAEHFPRIQFLVAKQKPYPDGLLSVITREQVKPEEVLLVDDRVLTGGLAATLAGIKCILIEKPYICFWDNMIRETIFMSLRAVERAVFR
ncbi:MAG: HAD-IA family hydrolase [Gammaproteobacteria bacterium]|nr:HAD-IA family hydrolase [Gammaproteobacteria bacterium]